MQATESPTKRASNNPDGRPRLPEGQKRDKLTVYARRADWPRVREYVASLYAEPRRPDADTP